jgi:sulfonate transport system substrate-binding protein
MRRNSPLTRRSEGGRRPSGSRRRVFLQVGLGLSLAASGVGFLSTVGTGGVGAATPNLSGVTLKVATYPAEGDNVLLQAAGLANTPYQVQYQLLASGALQSEAVNAGTADLGRASGISNALLAAAGDDNFVSVATLKIGTAEQDTIVLKSSGITSVKQLKGQKVAYIPDTTPQFFLLKQLKAAGLKWSDITPVAIEQPADGLAALLSGSVVAFATFGNVATAETQGAKVLASGGPYLADKLGALQGTYNLYKPDLNDPAKLAAVADFLARVDTAAAWARSHPTQYAQIVATNTDQPLATELATFKGEEASGNTWVGPNSPQSIGTEQDYANAFVSVGVIKPFNVATVFTDKLSKAIATDEAAYRKKYPSDFVVPAYAKSGENSSGQGAGTKS